jgi:hypothetical protein
MGPNSNPLKTGALARVLSLLGRRRKKPARPQRDRKPLRAWRINGIVFCALTRSEARALAKEQFGWERVPAGMPVAEVRAPAPPQTEAAA